MAVEAVFADSSPVPNSLLTGNFSGRREISADSAASPRWSWCAFLDSPGRSRRKSRFATAKPAASPKEEERFSHEVGDSRHAVGDLLVRRLLKAAARRESVATFCDLLDPWLRPLLAQPTVGEAGRRRPIAGRARSPRRLPGLHALQRGRDLDGSRGDRRQMANQAARGPRMDCGSLALLDSLLSARGRAQVATRRHRRGTRNPPRPGGGRGERHERDARRGRLSTLGAGPSPSSIPTC